VEVKARVTVAGRGRSAPVVVRTAVESARRRNGGSRGGAIAGPQRLGVRRAVGRGPWRQRGEGRRPSGVGGDGLGVLQLRAPPREGRRRRDANGSRTPVVGFVDFFSSGSSMVGATVWDL
jgi:hypothetical protein